MLTSCSRGLSSTTFSDKVGKIGDGLSLIPRSVTSSASLSTLLVAGLPGPEFAENLKSENLSEATKRVGNTIVARFWVSCVSSGTYANPTDFKSFFDRDREWVLDDMFFFGARNTDRLDLPPKYKVERPGQLSTSSCAGLRKGSADARLSG